MDPIILSAIKKAKKELEEKQQVSAQTLDDLKSALADLKDTKLPKWVQDILTKVDQSTDSTGTTLFQLKSSLEEKLSPWTGTRAAKLDNLDAKVSSRADGSYYTPARGNNLDKLDTTVSSRLSKTDFDVVLADLKKSSAEYRDRIAAVLGQMDAVGLSTEDSIKLLTQYLEDIPIMGAATSTLTTQGGSYTIPRGYHNGNGSVRTNITNLRPGNIKSGANVGGVVGSFDFRPTTFKRRYFGEYRYQDKGKFTKTHEFKHKYCVIMFETKTPSSGYNETKVFENAKLKPLSGTQKSCRSGYFGEELRNFVSADVNAFNPGELIYKVSQSEDRSLEYELELSMQANRTLLLKTNLVWTTNLTFGVDIIEME